METLGNLAFQEPGEKLEVLVLLDVMGTQAPLDLLEPLVRLAPRVKEDFEGNRV